MLGMQVFQRVLLNVGDIRQKFSSVEMSNQNP